MRLLGIAAAIFLSPLSLTPPLVDASADDYSSDDSPLRTLRQRRLANTSSGDRQLDSGCSSFTTCAGSNGLFAALKEEAAAERTLKVCASATPVSCRTTKNSGPSSLAFGSSTTPVAAVLECVSSDLGTERCILDVSVGEGLDEASAAYNAIFMANSGNSLDIRGFEFRGIRGSSRVAMIKNGAELIFRECVFTDNQHINGNTPVIVYDYGFPIPTTSIENSYFANNVGELLDLQSGTANLTGNIFYNNRAAADQKTNFISNKEVANSRFVLENNKFISNDSTGARTFFWLVATEDPAKLMSTPQLLEDVSGNCASENIITGVYTSVGIEECHNGIYTKGKWPDYKCTYFSPCDAEMMSPVPCDAFKPGSCGSSSGPGTQAKSSVPSALPTSMITSSPSEAPTPRSPVTFFVDCKDGNDDLDGKSRSTALRDPSKATTFLAPGDKVLIRGGPGQVCPTSIDLESDGKEDDPIMWLGGWPNDENDDGLSKAVIWGGSILQNKIKVIDTNLYIEGLGANHSHYDQLYVADLPSGMGIDDDDINLYNGEAASPGARRMSVAQWPNQPSAFKADDLTYYLSIPQDQINATTLHDTRLSEEWNENILLRSHVQVWVYGNRVERRKVVSFDQESSTITFDSELVPYDDRDSKYALLGAAEFIDAPGEYAVVSSPSSSISRSHVVAYPYSEDADFTASTRTRGVDLRFHGYNEFYNLDFAQFGGDQLFDGSAVYVGVSSEKIHGLRLVNNTFRHNYKRRGDTIRFNSLQDPVISHNKFYENANQRGIAVLSSDRAFISSNDVSGGSIYCGGCTHTIISDNVVQGVLPIHANGITIYQESNFTVAARNRVLSEGDSISLTIKASNGVCIVGNELVAQDAVSLALWKTQDDQENGVVLVHNYLATTFVMSDRLARCAIVNNALGGQPNTVEAYRNARTIHHNLHHKLDWNQIAEYGWVPFPDDILVYDWPSSSVFADQAGGDFSPVRCSPSIDSGAYIQDMETFVMSAILAKDSQGKYHPEALPIQDYLKIDRSGTSRVDDDSPDIGSLESTASPTYCTAQPTAVPTFMPSLEPSVTSSPTGIIIHDQPTLPSSEDECSYEDNFESCGDNPVEYFIDPSYGDDSSDGTSSAAPIRSISRAIEIANGNTSNPIIFHLAGGYYGEFGVGPWTNPFEERTSPGAWIQFIASTPSDGDTPVIFSNIEINNQVPLECRVAIRGVLVNSTAPGSSGDNNAVEIRRSSHVRIHKSVSDPSNLDEIWQVFSKKPQGVYTREASNIIISEIEVIGGRYGVVLGALGRWIQIINCDIHHQFEDAIRVASIEDVVISGNHIHDVADYYSTGQHIDGIQFFPSGPSGRYYYPQSHNILISENRFSSMVGQMVFIQANYVDKIGYMHNVTISKNILGPKTVVDDSCPVQVQGVKNYAFHSNTVVGKVLIRKESSGTLLGNIFGELAVDEGAAVLSGSDFNVFGELQLSTENTIDLGSSVTSTITYADMDSLDFAPMSKDACSGGLNGLHAGAVPCRECEWASSSVGPIANFAAHPARLSSDEQDVILIPSSSAICGHAAQFSTASWSISDGQLLTSSNLEDIKSLLLPSQGVYSIEFSLTDTSNNEDSFSRIAIRQAPATNDLIARYPLSLPYLADISPNKNPIATLTVPQNSTFAVGCDFDSYINLGYEDNIVLPESVRNSINLQPEFTASLWAKPKGPGQLLYKHVTVGIWIESSSEVNFAVGTNANATHNAWFVEDAATADFDSFDDQWHHYAISFNGNTIFGYIDGNLTASREVPITYASGQVRSGNWDMVIGHRIWKGRNLVGGVKDFRIFNRELNEGEIHTLSTDTVDCAMHAEAY